MTLTQKMFKFMAVLTGAAAIWLVWQNQQPWIASVLIVATGFLARPSLFTDLVMWIVLHTIYRVTVYGKEHRPKGGALLVANHISYVDALMIAATAGRKVHFVAHERFFTMPVLGWLLRQLSVIPIRSGRKESVTKAVEKVREHLSAGDTVCIFAEGQISRQGNLLGFRRGLEAMASGLNVPIIPVALDGLWGSLFSYRSKPAFKKLPKFIPYKVRVSYGPEMPSSSKAWQVRQAVQLLLAECQQDRLSKSPDLITRFLYSARKNWNRRALVDSLGRDLTYGRSLMGALLLRKRILQNTERAPRLGLLLPSSVGGGLANIATLMTGASVVNLNHTTGTRGMSLAIAASGIETILTSRTYVEKANIEIEALEKHCKILWIEDLLDPASVSGTEKLGLFVKARLMPVWLQSKIFAAGLKAGSEAAVLFSSGSTGTPKGVPLTHQNILSNVVSVRQLLEIRQSDCFLGILPFFHAFGLTATFWLPLMCGASVAFHPSPLEPKQIGALAGKYKATVLISAPTFCRGFLKACKSEDFANLRHAVVGAERLPRELSDQFHAKFGLPLMEGYGCTEMSPVVSVCRPDTDNDGRLQRGWIFGSVGRPLPGVAARVLDVDTGEILPPGKAGLLQVTGGNRMASYLDASRNEGALEGIWYNTGDIVSLDEEGFLYIRDRLARFSKLGGEMVPHVKIEQAVAMHNDIETALVVALPDPRKGERLVCLYVPIARAQPKGSDLVKFLKESKMPALWCPKPTDYISIAELPLLATGKVDLVKARDIAKQLLLKAA